MLPRAIVQHGRPAVSMATNIRPPFCVYGNHPDHVLKLLVRKRSAMTHVSISNLSCLFSRSQCRSISVLMRSNSLAVQVCEWAHCFLSHARTQVCTHTLVSFSLTQHCTHTHTPSFSLSVAPFLYSSMIYLFPQSLQSIVKDLCLYHLCILFPPSLLCIVACTTLHSSTHTRRSSCGRPTFIDTRRFRSCCDCIF